jgi:hypothetical protein
MPKINYVLELSKLDFAKPLGKVGKTVSGISKTVTPRSTQYAHVFLTPTFAKNLLSLRIKDLVCIDLGETSKGSAL